MFDLFSRLFHGPRLFLGQLFSSEPRKPGTCDFCQRPCDLDEEICELCEIERMAP